MGELLYVVPASERTPQGLRALLSAQQQIRFVSLSGVDLGGNDTDEKIPVSHFLGNAEEYLAGGVQTDGSSVVLPGIATLNDGKVDLVADTGVRWYVDYNHEHPDPATGLPVGTLRIPSFLKHRDRFIDSRAILKRTMESAGARLAALLAQHPAAAKAAGVDPRQVERCEIVAATELEFWVRTPGANVDDREPLGLPDPAGVLLEAHQGRRALGARGIARAARTLRPRPRDGAQGGRRHQGHA